jgi:hypothetical protein
MSRFDGPQGTAPAISAAMKRSWEEDGFLRIRRFFEPGEVAVLGRAVAEVSEWPPDRGEWLHHFERTGSGVRLSRSENFAPFQKDLQALLTRGKVVEAVSELMGEAAVLYKEKINYKYPGGGGYAAHQDAPAYEFVDYHVTCLISVDPATPENGCLFFSPGLHGRGFVALDEHGCIEETAAAQMEWVPVPTDPGDILFFGSYAPHHSPPNNTDQPRRLLYVTYNALSAGDLRERYYQDKLAAMKKMKENPEEAGMISKIRHFRGRTVL